MSERLDLPGPSGSGWHHDECTAAGLACQICYPDGKPPPTVWGQLFASLPMRCRDGHAGVQVIRGLKKIDFCFARAGVSFAQVELRLDNQDQAVTLMGRVRSRRSSEH